MNPESKPNSPAVIRMRAEAAALAADKAKAAEPNAVTKKLLEIDDNIDKAFEGVEKWAEDTRANNRTKKMGPRPRFFDDPGYDFRMAGARLEQIGAGAVTAVTDTVRFIDQLDRPEGRAEMAASIERGVHKVTTDPGGAAKDIGAGIADTAKKVVDNPDYALGYGATTLLTGARGGGGRSAVPRVTARTEPPAAATPARPQGKKAKQGNDKGAEPELLPRWRHEAPQAAREAGYPPLPLTYKGKPYGPTPITGARTGQPKSMAERRGVADTYARLDNYGNFPPIPRTKAQKAVYIAALLANGFKNAGAPTRHGPGTPHKASSPLAPTRRTRMRTGPTRNHRQARRPRWGRRTSANCGGRCVRARSGVAPHDTTHRGRHGPKRLAAH